jgi:hypothetical protein
MFTMLRPLVAIDAGATLSAAGIKQLRSTSSVTDSQE